MPYLITVLGVRVNVQIYDKPQWHNNNKELPGYPASQSWWPSHAADFFSDMKSIPESLLAIFLFTLDLEEHTTQIRVPSLPLWDLVTEI